MARAAGDQPRQRSDVDDLGALAALVVDLLVGPRRQEAGERVDDRQRAAARHAARHRHHVLLGDAALDESIGKALRERDQAAVLDQIGVEHHQVRTTIALPDERLFVGGNEILSRARLAPRISRRRFRRDRTKAQLGEQRVRRRRAARSRRRDRPLLSARRSDRRRARPA